MTPFVTTRRVTFFFVTAYVVTRRLRCSSVTAFANCPYLMPRTSYHAASSVVALVRQQLGLTQLELALYLGVSRDTVAQEISPSRSLPWRAQGRLTRLFQLAPWLGQTLVLPPYPRLDSPPTLPPVAPAVLPFPPEPAQVEVVRRAAQNSSQRLYKARYALWTVANGQALLARRQRVLTDFAMPPAVHVLPDEAPDRTARLLTRLRDYVAEDTAPSSPLHPAAVTYQHLRLHLLETEAATLAAWLAAA